MNKKSNLFYPIFVVSMILLTVDGVCDSNDSKTEFDKQLPDDIWTNIIGGGYNAKKELGRLTAVNRLSNQIGKSTGMLNKMKMEDEMQAIIKLLQTSDIALITPYKIFRNATCDKLMQQYLHGFYGELQYILAAIGKIDDKPVDIIDGEQRLWIRKQILALKKLLKDYKETYGDQLIPMHQTIDPVNISSVDMIRFNQFMLMQQECERFMTMLEEMSGEHYDAVSAIISNFKVMMQQIGVIIGYPGIMRLDHPDINVKEYLETNAGTFVRWRRLINSTIDDNDNEAIKQFKIILQAIPAASILCDAIIVFLDKVKDAFLTDY